MAPKTTENPLRGLEANFAEIHPPMDGGEAAIEANRCLYCYDAPCIQACPTHIEVPRYIKQIVSRDFAGAARTILEANPLGHSCARVCPVEVLCEGACVYVAWHEKPIEIARLQRHATEPLPLFRAAGEGARRAGEGPGFVPGKPTGKKLAVIGSGPSGLSAAFYLARLGHAVTIFDRKPLPGGLNSYGIAEYKMTQQTAVDEVALVKSLGVTFKHGVSIGEDLPFAKLEKDFDAVFLGVGLGATNHLGLPGEDLGGVWEALTFIERVKTRKFHAIDIGRTVVVIGAGNTAVDVVTQAKRLGAQRVIMAYRRGPEDAPAYDYEIELAKQDAVELLWHAAPVEILPSSARSAGEGARRADEGQRVGAVRFQKTRKAKAGLEPIPGSEFLIECDRVIKAIGQSKMTEMLKTVPGLALDPSGRIVVDTATMRTSNPRYYAGGDAVNGGKEVVNAVAHGKRAAWAMHQALTGERTPAAEHAYWVSTIEGRKIAPIPARMALPPAPSRKRAGVTA